MTHSQTGIEHDVIARILDVLAERHIFRAHVDHLDTLLATNALELAIEVGVGEIIKNLLAAGEEAHARIGHFHEIGIGKGGYLLLGLVCRLARLDLIHELLHVCLGVLRLEELKGTILGKELLVPILDDGKLLVVGHHVIARDNGMKLGALNELNQLRRREDDVGIDGNEDIVVLAVKRLLVLAAANIETECLHAGKGDEGALARADDDVVTIGRDQDMKRLCPGKKEGLAEMITRETDDDTGLLWWLLRCLRCL